VHSIFISQIWEILTQPPTKDETIPGSHQVSQELTKFPKLNIYAHKKYLIYKVLFQYTYCIFTGEDMLLDYMELYKLQMKIQS
jgi:hypothetical protein